MAEKLFSTKRAVVSGIGVDGCLGHDYQMRQAY